MLILNCPNCEESMELGYVKSSNPVFWTREKKNSFMLPKDAVFICSPRISLKGQTNEAYNCIKCKMIVFNY